MDSKRKMELKVAASRAVSFALFGDARHQSAAIRSLQAFVDELKQDTPSEPNTDEALTFEWWPSILPPSAATEDNYPIPKGGWVCFHCGDQFTDIPSARLHFGTSPKMTTACLIKAEETSLLTALRKAETERDDVVKLLHNLQSLSLDELQTEVARLLNKDKNDATQG